MGLSPGGGAARQVARLTPLLAVAMLAAGCGHKKQVVLAPPTPAMPPGVTWGPPAAARSAVPGRRTSSATASAATRSRLRYPTPPTANMPAGNYNPDPRVGEIWETGIASFYGVREQGRATASGQPMDYHKMTAAHRLLPLGTRIQVTDLKTNKSVVVRINDRGPFWPNRLLDLSYGAAKRIGDAGLDRVRIKIVSLPKPVPAGIYTVQVGWFTSKSELDKCRRQMERQLHHPVIAFGSNEGRWLRYSKSVGLDMPTAESEVRSLRANHFPAYLVRLN